MSPEDLEVVRAAFDGAFGLEEIASRYWHPEIEYVEDPRWPGASTYRGRDAVVRCFDAYNEALGRAQSLEVERVLDAGETAVAVVRFKLEGSASGVPTEHVWGYVVEVRDGRIAHFRAYYDPAEALAAVGLAR